MLYYCDVNAISAVVCSLDKFCKIGIDFVARSKTTTAQKIKPNPNKKKTETIFSSFIAQSPLPKEEHKDSNFGLYFFSYFSCKRRKLNKIVIEKKLFYFFVDERKQFGKEGKKLEKAERK